MRHDWVTMVVVVVTQDAAEVSLRPSLFCLMDNPERGLGKARSTWTAKGEAPAFALA